MNRTSRRFKGLSQGAEYFHCVSRVVDRRMVLKTDEKEEFIRIMRIYEAFYGVRILSYCIMTNHFHLLLEVPKRPAPEDLPSDEALVGKVSAALGEVAGRGLREELKHFRENGMAEAAEALRERYFARMWDVSSYMQVVKQRFTQWYNRSRKRKRKGTLWEDRFRSVLVAGEGDALKTMAAYIDLNPVRAGIVQDPGDYRWSSYGEAMGGGRKAIAGLAWIAGIPAHGGENRKLSPKAGLEAYRCALFGRAETRTDGVGGVVKRGAKPEQIRQVIAAKGRVPVEEYLRHRVRYFTDGAVIGSKAFLEEVFVKVKDRFGKNRQSGARRMRGVIEPLFSLRDLQRDVRA
jgi:REP element-mobilizing transposase RayT